MKKVIIGAVITLIGSIWGLGILLFVGNHLVSSWYSPPGRFLTSLAESQMTLPFILSIILILLSLIILGIEYFRKDISE
jgi:hypothetical protein